MARDSGLGPGCFRPSWPSVLLHLPPGQVSLSPAFQVQPCELRSQLGLRGALALTVYLGVHLVLYEKYIPFWDQPETSLDTMCLCCGDLKAQGHLKGQLFIFDAVVSQPAGQGVDNLFG